MNVTVEKRLEKCGDGGGEDDNKCIELKQGAAVEKCAENKNVYKCRVIFWVTLTVVFRWGSVGLPLVFLPSKLAAKLWDE